MASVELHEDLHQRRTDRSLVTCAAGLVHVFDRHGQRIDEISCGGNGPLLSLEWDGYGESLAVLREGSGIIPIWEASSRSTLNFDTNLKDPTYMSWSRIGPQLAIGTAKGNFLMYNKNTRKKIPVLGKHPRRITCGAWSDQNQLVLGSSDNTLTLSNEAGDTIDQSQLRRTPTQMCFVSHGKPVRSPKGSQQVASEAVVAVNLSGKSLLLYNPAEPETPVELAFQQKYGSIVVHRAIGEARMLIGFSEVSSSCSC